MAEALRDQRGLDAVHVIAHGEPGRVLFSSGLWSAEMLRYEAEDLAAIGRALAPEGELRLWSCNAAAGPSGARFIEHLAETAGAMVAASSERIGAAALGGSWDLTRAARAPLTAAGVAGYAGVLTNETWNGNTNSNFSNTISPGNGTWTNTGTNWDNGAGPSPGANDNVFISWQR